MATYQVKATTREVVGKKNKKLREQGYIPAVLYGSDIKSQNLSLQKNEFLKVYNIASSSSLMDLQINDSQPVKTLIQDIQSDPRTDEIIHVDFYQIKEGKKITAELELDFISEAPAVKELGGILVKSFNEVEIECLPKYLEDLESIKVDLSGLKTFHDSIHIKDLQVPEGIKITQAENDVVVQVTSPIEEKEEEKPIEEGGEGEEGEGGEEGEERKAEGKDTKEGGEVKEESKEGQAPKEENKK